MLSQFWSPVRVSLLLCALSLGLTACPGKEASKTASPSTTQVSSSPSLQNQGTAQPGAKATTASSATAKSPATKSTATKSTATKSAAQPKPDLAQIYQEAIDKAEGARSISQSAQSAEELQMGVDRWKTSIQLMHQVIQANPKHPKAQQTLANFQTGLGQAQSRLARAQGRDPSSREVGVDPCLDPEFCGSNVGTGKSGGKNYRVRIKSYYGGIPVVDVRCNGSQTFEMMVDTGATSTMITEDMATSLQVKRTGSVSVGTASGVVELSTGTVRSLSLGGGTIFDLSVIIGPVGLLGHDFFGDCDVTIRRNQNVVEFSQCSS
jgi:gag-polyprotein putative aspartyl protease